MRDKGICLHEAGHLVASRILAGRTVDSITWEPDGGATIRAAIKGEHPTTRALIAVMGHAAVALMAPHLQSGLGMSSADVDMFEGAVEDVAGGYGLKRREYVASIGRYARAFTHKYADEIMELARTLQETGDVPKAYLHPAVVRMSDLKAELAEVEAQIEAEQAQNGPPPSEQEVEQLLDEVDQLVAAHQSASPKGQGPAGMEYKASNPERPHVFDPAEFAGIKWLNATGRPL